MGRIPVSQNRKTAVEPAEVLRLLAANAPGGARWRDEFQRLREALAQQATPDPTVFPGLIRLAMAQDSRRGACLALAERCLRTGSGPETLGAHWRDLRAAYPFLRDCLFRDACRDSRAAAARLLSSFSEESQVNRVMIDWALRAERDPRTAATLMASLHSLRRQDPSWVQTLAQFQTPLNDAAVRFQAACCRLDAENTAAPEVIAELVGQLYGEDGQALPTLRAIAVYGAQLPRGAAVAVWSALLAAAEEFDGAAEIACRLLRALTGDRREGWGQVRLTARSLTGESAPLPGVVSSVLRLACAGVFQKLTGRKLFLPLPAGQRPAREYPEVRAFPPRLDHDDPLVRSALVRLVDCEPLWQGHTDMWRLFGLPERRLELRLLLDRAVAATPPA